MIPKVLKKVMVALLGMMIIVGCSSDDNDVSIVGHWMASHHSKNPKYADTADMWDFTFKPDGTGIGPYDKKSFSYDVNGNRVTLTYKETEGNGEQIVFVYKIVSFSENKMEWDEIPQDSSRDNYLFLHFYRK